VARREQSVGSSRWRGAAWGAAIALSLAVIAAVPGDGLPWLRGPAEWIWGYHPGGRVPVPAASMALAVTLLVALSGIPVARRRASPVVAGLLTSAVVLGASFHLALVDPTPLGRLRALLRRAVSASVTSYHSVAISPAGRDPVAFVRRHADLLPQLDQHAATHPPGPVLHYRAAIGLCEHFPRLADALLDIAGVPRGERPPPLTRAARAGALLGVLLFDLAGLLVVWPLYRLGVALGLDALAAARLGLVWVVLPGPALMPARLDQAIAFPVTAYVVMLLAAARGSSPATRAGSAALAGVVAGLGLFLSYGAALFLVFGALAALAALALGREPAARSLHSRWLLACAISAAVAASVSFGIPALAGGEPVRAMLVALDIHRRGFTATRSYGLWLGWNLVDFTIFVGVPVAVLAACRGTASVHRVLRGDRIGPSAAFGLAAVVLPALLSLSGLTRGEVGRLWIPVMPLLLAGAVPPADAADGRRMAILCLLVASEAVLIGSFWSL
jgi:hypothetical protein